MDDDGPRPPTKRGLRCGHRRFTYTNADTTEHFLYGSFLRLCTEDIANIVTQKTEDEFWRHLISKVHEFEGKHLSSPWFSSTDLEKQINAAKSATSFSTTIFWESDGFGVLYPSKLVLPSSNPSPQYIAISIPYQLYQESNANGLKEIAATDCDTGDEFQSNCMHTGLMCPNMPSDVHYYYIPKDVSGGGINYEMVLVWDRTIEGFEPMAELLGDSGYAYCHPSKRQFALQSWLNIPEESDLTKIMELIPDTYSLVLLSNYDAASDRYPIFTNVNKSNYASLSTQGYLKYPCELIGQYKEFAYTEFTEERQLWCSRCLSTTVGQSNVYCVPITEENLKVMKQNRDLLKSTEDEKVQELLAEDKDVEPYTNDRLKGTSFDVDTNTAANVMCFFSQVALSKHILDNSNYMGHVHTETDRPLAFCVPMGIGKTEVLVIRPKVDGSGGFSLEYWDNGTAVQGRDLNESDGKAFYLFQCSDLNVINLLNACFNGQTYTPTTYTEDVHDPYCAKPSIDIFSPPTTEAKRILTGNFNVIKEDIRPTMNPSIFEFLRFHLADRGYGHTNDIAGSNEDPYIQEFYRRINENDLDFMPTLENDILFLLQNSKAGEQLIPFASSAADKADIARSIAKAYKEIIRLGVNKRQSLVTQLGDTPLPPAGVVGIEDSTTGDSI